MLWRADRSYEQFYHSLCAKHNGNGSLFEEIEKILDTEENEEPYFSPPFYEVAYDLLKKVCIVLFDEGHEAMIADLIEVQLSKNLGIRFINKFLFAPSVLKMKSLKEIWNWHKQETPTWVIWEYLYAACWAWNTPAQFFARKSINWDGPVQCRHTMQLVDLHETWCKMQIIRKGNPDNRNISFFTIMRFSHYLREIERQILSLQNNKTQEEDAIQSPHSLELALNGNQLLLIVQWVKIGVPISYILRRFYYKSDPLTFISNLLSVEVETEVKIPEECSQSASKLTKRAGLTKEMEKLFIKNRKRDHCILKTKKSVIDIDEINIKNLKEAILKLPLALQIN